MQTHNKHSPKRPISSPRHYGRHLHKLSQNRPATDQPQPSDDDHNNSKNKNKNNGQPSPQSTQPKKKINKRSSSHPTPRSPPAQPHKAPPPLILPILPNLYDPSLPIDCTYSPPASPDYIPKIQPNTHHDPIRFPPPDYNGQFTFRLEMHQVCQRLAGLHLAITTDKKNRAVQVQEAMRIAMERLDEPPQAFPPDDHQHFAHPQLLRAPPANIQLPTSYPVRPGMRRGHGHSSSSDEDEGGMPREWARVRVEYEARVGRGFIDPTLAGIDELGGPERAGSGRKKKGGGHCQLGRSPIARFFVEPDEWICAFCEHELWFGEPLGLLRVIKNRKDVLRRRRRAKERAARAASGVPPTTPSSNNPPPPPTSTTNDVLPNPRAINSPPSSSNENTKTVKKAKNNFPAQPLPPPRPPVPPHQQQQQHAPKASSTSPPTPRPRSAGRTLDGGDDDRRRPVSDHRPSTLPHPPPAPKSPPDKLAHIPPPSLPLTSQDH
ncbi:hypothetical protein PtA15_9A244 [Puccinia triticina]|uniref:Uncharacterized protein n=1 Tax=Puccinia triticina TaxID=208348 RepID=A0ABY7CU29_9BASI|nr:uncharacterized protein PtA15_9A244 [Puccinia triticina]WAQ88119.1 hypothetical protein PtA15_9A244 [Puccinia triticina]